MWFVFAEGCDKISVERQAFVPEVTDDKGRQYFRAPNHFAPQILSFKGFAAAEPPEGSPADLPLADPLRDNAIAEMTKRIAALEMENSNLRSDYNAVNAKNAALMNEAIELKAKLESAEGIAEGLREQIEDQGVGEVVPLKKVGK